MRSPLYIPAKGIWRSRQKRLLLRCVHRYISPQKGSGEAGRSESAGKNEVEDGCKGLKKVLASGVGESGDEAEGAAGGVELEEGYEEEETAIPYSELGDTDIDDGFPRPRTPDPFMEGPSPIPRRGEPLPPADPPVTLGNDKVEERGSEMQEVVFLIRAGQKLRMSVGAQGRSLAGLLRQAFYCRQKNKNVVFGPDVPPEAVAEFKRLVGEIERLLFNYHGVRR
ncbi:LOW QUALITY PROTEIN: uncharacterized protein EMH_0001830 [Eimeria mitis]|uniref:Uncharacterized protein n=1 Tax=Eimeria mitis TaxID=44415 RepID=U6JYK7_9EIME|nr:LOW QUALITY PROTEIN: uncharacterized protein EMH_0001830 [Eimeria mitis]CDJ28608.1 hypothetical protein EMH_0001830 [Eimeria mitis]